MANIERHESCRWAGSPLQCFLTGLGTGVALTLLLAPQSGAATRRLIARRVSNGEDWISDKVAEAKDRVATRGGELVDRVKEVAEDIGRS